MDNDLLTKGFNGSILIAQNDTVIYEKYHGKINLNKNDSINEHTAFQIASAGKTLTAVAVLQLIQEGKLTLEDSLQKFFPGFPYAGITVRMLLSHHSGLPNYLYFIDDSTWDKTSNLTNQDVLNILYAKHPVPDFSPGARFLYSNTNFVLLALIIEKISGKKFPAYMKERFFDPLQMTDTYVFTPADSAKAIYSFNYNNRLWQNDIFDWTYGDKNIYSTPRDLFKWSHALFSGQLINHSLMDSAFSPQISGSQKSPKTFSPKHYYGLGFRLMYTPDGKKVIYHFGRWHGFNAAFARLEDEKVTIIILGNRFSKMIYYAAWKSYNLFGDYFKEQEHEEDDTERQPGRKQKLPGKIEINQPKRSIVTENKNADHLLFPDSFSTLWPMKLLSAKQTRDWDQYTILHEPITSIELMERAATKCVEWIKQHFPFPGNNFIVFCGKGNNGGDGLAIARMLIQQKRTVTVYILEPGHKGSDDFQANLSRLQASSKKEIHFIQNKTFFPAIPENSIVIDALFGSGLSRPLEGINAELVEHINQSGCKVISIDIPSGLFIDTSSLGNPVIKATHTLSIQTFKLSFLVAENSSYTGNIQIINIGLMPEFLSDISIQNELVDEEIIRSIYKPRNPYAHKGKFGHALLVAGSYGKMGAAVLAAKACLRSGVGLLTCHIPQCGYTVLQTAQPEAMVVVDSNSAFITNAYPGASDYNAIGIGPGIGTAAETRSAIRQLLKQYKRPVVIDADGLNCISMEKEILTCLPPCSILTPHPKEFERLFGECRNEYERIEKAVDNARSLNCIIVLKGHHTFIATPSGKGYFNNTGNAGMATGGSGDVLTGIITGLLAQNYEPVNAAVLGVYLHGTAGDFAAKKLSEEAMIASDIIEYIGDAFTRIFTQ